MASVLHSWLNHAQENTRFDSVAGKYGLVVDIPGMSQTGQNARNALRSLTVLADYSPAFFEDQARLWSPPTPDLLLDLPAVLSPTSPPHSALATPNPISMAPARRPAQSQSQSQGARTPQFDDALFSFDIPPSDDPIFVPNHHHHHRHQQRARPYPALPRIQPYPDLAPLGGTYFPPPPDPSPSLSPWDTKQFTHYPQPLPQNYPSPLQSQPTPDQAQLVASPELGSEPSELEMQQLGGDADRARMSALMYASMRARAVATASEADGQGW
ncbi:unnamed protein product [Rhizoctonia solani]|uniref:Uncharacterized protein n=1 Tax=Rhizoctonia solani TaxID=456999 RepID=A0A8H2WF45_9AGAM|nr:unnamed protein product [Rhizoctonia solani]